MGQYVMNGKNNGLAFDFENDAQTKVNGSQWQAPPLHMQQRCSAF